MPGGDQKRQRVVILGAGGHGRVVAELLAQDPRVELAGTLDPRGGEIPGVPHLGGDEQLPRLRSEGVDSVVVAVGALGNPRLRQRLCELVLSHGLTLARVTAASAYISPSAQIEAGVQILPISVVNSAARIGQGTVVYSGAVVEHDCRVGRYVLVAPRAAIAGGVVIGDRTQIGIGAVIREGIQIASDTIIGAGAVVVKNIEEPGCYFGVPARMRERTPTSLTNGVGHG